MFHRSQRQPMDGQRHTRHSERHAHQHREPRYKDRPTIVGQQNARGRTQQARTGVVEQPVQAGGTAPRLTCLHRDDAAGHGMGTEEGEGQDAHSHNDAFQTQHQQKQQAQHHQQQRTAQQRVRAVVVGQTARQHRTGHAGRVHQEDTRHHVVGQPEGRRLQQEGQVIVDAHKDTHRQGGNEVGPYKATVAQQTGHLSQLDPDGHNRRTEVARSGKQPHENHAQQQADGSDDQHRHVPVGPTGQQGARHPARHAAQRIAAQVQTDGQADDRGIHLLGQVGQRYGRDTGQHRPFQEIGQQEQRIVEGKHRKQRQQARSDERSTHQPAARHGIGLEGQHKQADGHPDGRGRNGQTARHRRYAVEAAQVRQQGLEQIQLRKDRKAGKEHAQTDAAEAFPLGGADRV